MAEVIQSELSSGTMLNGGKYVIEKKIGAGGFGITYLAQHTILDRKFAIKEFFMSGYNVRNNATNHISLQGIEVSDFDRVRRAFINEARTLAHLNNESIVKVIDIFDENGTSYMVMPFVEGSTLKSMVEKDGPMGYEMAVNYMVQICEALSYIHSKNILHRDVTPDNVIVTPEQKIVLIDFGSARKFIDNKTQRQTTIVKPGYAPLEQHSAKSRKGAFTDVYSAGAVFYYLLTGERPMDATERVLEKMKEPIELNPNIPPQINTIIMKAMEMDGEMRYQSAKEMIDDIFSDEPQSSEDTNEEDVLVVETDILPPKTPLNKEGDAVPISIYGTMSENDTNQPQSPQKTKKKSKGGVWIAVFVAVVAITAAVVVFLLSESSEKKLARENIELYEQKVKACQANIDAGSYDDNNYRVLITAQDELEEIKSFEEVGQRYYPDTYNCYSSLKNKLDKKIQEIVQQYEDLAKMCIKYNNSEGAEKAYDIIRELYPNYNSSEHE